jgi:uncharacterized membrane protein
MSKQNKLGVLDVLLVALLIVAFLTHTEKKEKGDRSWLIVFAGVLIVVGIAVWRFGYA